MALTVVVLMASGDEDTWPDVLDGRYDEAGYLQILEKPEDPEAETSVCLAAYAPGMWMKVEYQTSD